MRPIFLALLAGLLVSCRSTPPAQPPSTAPVASPPTGFLYSETGEFFQNRPLGPGSTTVDYKSTINVEPVSAELAQDVLPELTPEQKQEMRLVAELAQSLNDVLMN